MPPLNPRQNLSSVRRRQRCRVFWGGARVTVETC